jgi:erythromycin esterase-like protein
LGKTRDAQEIVAWMREHQADSRDTAQGTLLEAGDADGAAALLLARLDDTNERASALESIQNYAQTPRTERQQKLDALNETLLARADVAAAIAKYGRREKVPIYSTEY